jgi:hypothetical protein
MWIPGEWEKGMTKEPIMIEPTDTLESLSPSARLRCGKIYSMEWNIKARNIGMVASRDKAKLVRYYREGRKDGFDSDDDYHGDDSSQIPSPNPPPIYRSIPQPSADLPASSEDLTGPSVSQMPAR